MDELNFRKAILADPQHLDDSVEQSLVNDEPKKGFLKDIRGLDKKIQQAARVAVPEELSKQLILRQSMLSYEHKKARTRSIWALAASVAFLSAILIYGQFSAPANTIGDHALAHVYYEMDHTKGVDENLVLANVNAKLATLGGQFSEDVGKVYFANFCDFKGVRTLHMIMQGESGNVSVFVVPHNSDLKFSDRFADDRFNGTALKGQNADMVIIGEKGEPLDKTKEKLASRIQWQI